MKQKMALMLVLIILLSLLCGCAEEPEEPKPKLRIAVSPDFAPMEFVDPTKRGQEQFVGFDITLAKYIAQQLDMELEIMPMEFNACQMAVYAGTVDLSISGYTWNEKRAEDYNISNRYFAGNGTDEQYLIVSGDKAADYTDAQSLAGARVAVQSASLQLTLAQQQLPQSMIYVFFDMDTAVLQLINGDFDCIAVSGGNGEAILANHPELARSSFNFEVEEKYRGYVILLQKGNDELTEKINEILASAQPYFDLWYAEAKAIAGIEVTYDEQGNVADESRSTIPGDAG